jgi:hypothetical protein
MQYFKIGIRIFVRHKERIGFQILNGYRKHELAAEKPFNFNKGESFYDKSTIIFYHNALNPSLITTNEQRQRQ